MCGWRRLRQLLAEGDGVFWTRDAGGRLWLRGATKVAAALGVGRLRGAPVELPVAALTGGIQQTRAHFYAAFHSSREASPISRSALREISGVPGRTQLAYEDVARVRVRPNLAVAERYSREGHQQRAWERGRSTFRFVDHKGTLGKPGNDYLAWRLPNSYEGPHARRSRGGQRRLNRQLGDLVQKGIPGNDENRPGADRRRNDEKQAAERVFWPSGSKAARAFNREPERDAFWPVNGTDGHSVPRERVWSVIDRCGEQPDRSVRKTSGRSG